MLLCYPAYVRTQSFVNPLDEDAGQDVETPPRNRRDPETES
jgi:hypothetical protein